jgi:PAS domain S-box-containing protein
MPSSHSVQFYESDSVFLDRLSEFTGASLGSGGACIVIATKTHREELVKRLEQFGVDVSTAAVGGRYIALDAEETLARFMVADRLDRELFRAALEPLLLRAQAALGRKGARIAVFGEMVIVLWERGQHEAAAELEQSWDELVERYPLILRCAYPIGCFASESTFSLFQQICAKQAEVIPTEEYTSLGSEDERHRLGSSLRRKALLMRAVVDEREREIEQRKAVEEKLRRSEEFARNVVESSDDCVMLLDLYGRLAYVSPPGQRALEITDDGEILGRRWVDLWKDEDRPRAEAALALAKTGGVGCFQGDSATARGTRKSWDVKITPASGANGEIEGLIALSRDITDLRRAQQMAIQAEKLAAAGRMAATIAHEINNPLEAVTNFIYLARTTPGLPETVQRHLEIADRELSRVAQIAQKTLGFYRDTSKNRWIDVCELIQDVMLIYDRKMTSRRIQASVSVRSGLAVYGKQGEIKQALANLIANAVDASKAGGKIWVRARASKRWTDGMAAGVRITLADNGSGMPPDVQRRIFVPFFTTKAEVGTGIGLWVTKSIIEQYGGCLHFRSRQGERAGTVMSFFIPDGRRENEAVSMTA